MPPVVARPLTNAEAAVLRAAVENAAVGTLPKVFNPQAAIAGARVHSVCDCGCASIGFLPASEPEPQDAKLIADAMAYRDGNAGEWIGIHVYATATGKLLEMELHTPYDSPALLPNPEHVRAWPPDP